MWNSYSATNQGKICSKREQMHDFDNSWVEENNDGLPDWIDLFLGQPGKIQTAGGPETASAEVSAMLIFTKNIISSD